MRQVPRTFRDFPIANKELSDISRLNPMEVIDNQASYVLALFKAGWIQVNFQVWLQKMRSYDFIGKQDGNTDLIYFAEPEQPEETCIQYIETRPSRFSNGPDVIQSIANIHNAVRASPDLSHPTNLDSLTSIFTRLYFIRYTLEHAKSISSRDFCTPRVITENPSYTAFTEIKDIL